MKVRELLSDESKWTQGDYARDAEGFCVSVSGPTACKWCLLGAVQKCYGSFYIDYAPVWGRVCERLRPESRDPLAWNDDGSRTFAEVKALVDELDI